MRGESLYICGGRAWRPAAALAALVCLGGCGWTARDEFTRAQRVTLSATPVEGSMGALPARREPIAVVPDEEP